MAFKPKTTLQSQKKIKILLIVSHLLQEVEMVLLNSSALIVMTIARVIDTTNSRGIIPIQMLRDIIIRIIVTKTWSCDIVVGYKRKVCVKVVLFSFNILFNECISKIEQEIETKPFL